MDMKLIWQIGGIRGNIPFYATLGKPKQQHTTKFEDLDGEQGGGNNAKQYDVVIKIINHLELTGQIPDEKLLKIDPESFGKNDYFQKRTDR